MSEAITPTIDSPTATTTTKVNAKRIIQVDQMVDKHLEAMMNEIWNTLKESEKTLWLGSALFGMQCRLKAEIVDEIVCITGCD